MCWVDELPLEIRLEVLAYLSLEEACRLVDVSEGLSEAVLYLVSHTVNKLPQLLGKRLEATRRTLLHSDLNHDQDRLQVTRNMVYLHWFASELAMLTTLTNRYMVSLGKLCPALGPALQELSLRTAATEDQTTSLFFWPPTPCWDSFLKEFDTCLEPSLNLGVPLSVKIADLMSCGLNINWQFSLKPGPTCSSFRTFHQMSDCAIPPPSLGVDKSTQGNEAELMRFLRSALRIANRARGNRTYMNLLHLELSFASAEPNFQIIEELEDMYHSIIQSSTASFLHTFPRQIPPALSNKGIDYTSIHIIETNKRSITCSIQAKNVSNQYLPLMCWESEQHHILSEAGEPDNCTDSYTEEVKIIIDYDIYYLTSNEHKSHTICISTSGPQQMAFCYSTLIESYPVVQ